VESSGGGGQQSWFEWSSLTVRPLPMLGTITLLSQPMRDHHRAPRGGGNRFGRCARCAALYRLPQSGHGAGRGEGDGDGDRRPGRLSRNVAGAGSNE
jgi:hypothetical protein